MSRELNREIFGETLPVHNRIDEPLSHDTKYVSESSFRELIKKVSDHGRKLSELESKMISLDNKLNDLARATKSRFERHQSGYLRMQELLKQTVHDITAKVSSMSGRVAERRVSDAKVEEMIERHNQIVQSFENRLSQLQKVISEQDMKLMGYKHRLEELGR